VLQQVPHMEYRIGQLQSEAETRRLANTPTTRSDRRRMSRSSVTGIAAATIALIVVAGVAMASGPSSPSGAAYSTTGGAGLRYHR
jgi:ferric-dicitrate binding protein FerR (iron transport regulator)